MTPGGPLLLGIDLGTSAVKVLVADLDGRVEGRGAAGYPTQRPAPDRAEQDPADWWAATLTAVRAALATVDAARVVAAAIDGQCHGAVLLAREGRGRGDGRGRADGPGRGQARRGSDEPQLAALDAAAPEPAAPAAPKPAAPGAPEPTTPAAPEPTTPAAPEPTTPAAPDPPAPARRLARDSAEPALLGPAIVWLDDRSGAEVEALTRAFGPGTLVEAVGGPLATGFQAPTLAWLRTHEPRVFERIGCVISPKDWLRLRLTGSLAGDPSDASCTGLADVRTRTWWQPMLHALEIGRDQLPPLADGPTSAGGLLPAAAAALGLRTGITVAVGASDTPVGLLGAGLVDEDGALLSISTGATLVVPARGPAGDPAGACHTLCGALPPAPGIAGWYRMSATLAAGAALGWLREAILRDAAPGAFDRLVGLAAAEPIGANGLVFLPHLAGERGPRAAARARASFVGLTLRHGPGALVRAVLEGVTFSLADAAEALAAGAPLPGRLVLAGGGARSAVWTQMVADVLDRPIQRLVAEEGAALGACLLAGAAAGLLDVAKSARAWARLAPPIEPAFVAREAWASARAAYRSADAALLPMFRRAAAR